MLQHEHAKTSKGTTILLGALIVVVTFLPYVQTAAHGFINLDDCTYVSNCAKVKQGLTWSGFWWAFTTLDYAAIWMPLTWISYMVDVSLWGIVPGPMHLENALIHAVDAVLLYVLLLLLLRCFLSFIFSPAHNRRTTGSTLLRADRGLAVIAALSTLFWSLHPLRVEPVAWIASRKDVLSVFWELLAFIFWVKAVMAREVSPTVTNATRPVGSAAETSGNAQPTASSLQPTLYRFASLLCFVCACLSKPTAMTFPILAGLLEFLLTRRVRWDHYTFPFLGALGVAWIAQYGQVVGGATESLSQVPFYGRVLNAVAAFGTYCWQVIVPTHLAAAHVHKWPDLPIFLVPGLLICALYGGCLIIFFWRSGACGLLLSELPTALLKRFSIVRASEWHKGLAANDASAALFVGLAWFLIAVAPMLGLSNFGFHSHAERFTYLPAIGFSVAMVIVWARLPDKAARSLGILLVTMLGIGFCLSWWQVGFWKNDKTLFSRALEVDPVRNDVAHRNLGLYYYGVEHNIPVSLSHFEKMFQVNRARNRNAQLYYIYALAESGLLDRAKEETRDLDRWKEECVSKETKFDMSEERPTYFRVLDTFLAYALIAHFEKDDELAKQHLDYVAGVDPKNMEVHFIKGLIAYDNQQIHDAIEQWSACTEIAGFVVRPYLRQYLKELRKK